MYVMYKNRVFKSIDGKGARKKTFADFDSPPDPKDALKMAQDMLKLLNQANEKTSEMFEWIFGQDLNAKDSIIGEMQEEVDVVSRGTMELIKQVEKLVDTCKTEVRLFEKVYKTDPRMRFR